MRAAPPRPRRASWLQQLQPAFFVLGVVLIAGIFRAIETNLFEAFKRAHTPEHFVDEKQAEELYLAAREVDSLLGSSDPLSQGLEGSAWQQPLAAVEWQDFADPAIIQAPKRPESGGAEVHYRDPITLAGAGAGQRQPARSAEVSVSQLPEHAPAKIVKAKPAAKLPARPAVNPAAVPPEGAGDAVVERNYVVAEGDPNKCYTNHASSIAQVAPGELLVAWFGGTDENAPDVAIWTSRYAGGQWGPAVEVVAPESRDHTICGKHLQPPVPCKWQNSTWNPVLYTMPDGEVLLFYKKGPHPSEWQGFLMRSKDKGLTWDAPARLPVMGPAKHKPIMLPNGVLLAGSSTESGRASEKRLWQCWIDFSRDSGHTWERVGPVPFDGNIIQPSLWLGEDMTVHLLARTATDYDKSGKRADPVKNKKEMIYRGAQYLIHAQSDSTGLSWTTPGKPVFDLPSPNAAGDVVRLRDGRLLVIYNHSKERKALGRSTLLLAMSEDGGSKWKVVLELEDGPPNDPTQEFSYPSIIQAADNDLVHMTYTYRRRNIRHIVVDPANLRPLAGKKFGKEYSGVKGHYDTSVLSSSMHHLDQQPQGKDAKAKRDGKGGA